MFPELEQSCFQHFWNYAANLYIRGSDEQGRYSMSFLSEINRFLHKVYMQSASFLSSRPHWVPRTPSPARECCSFPLLVQGGRHTRLRGRGWGDPNPTKGQTLWYSMYTIIPLRVFASSQYLRSLKIFLKIQHCFICRTQITLCRRVLGLNPEPLVRDEWKSTIKEKGLWAHCTVQGLKDCRVLYLKTGTLESSR